jgi:hypothetical protein
MRDKAEGSAMLTMFITFVVVTTAYAGVFWFGFRRVALHLRGNQEATKAVVEHVLIPLFGRNPKAPAEEEAGEEESQAKPSAWLRGKW